MTYNDTGFDNTQNSKPTTCNCKGETIGNKKTVNNREIKDNGNTTNSDKADFIDFNGRFSGKNPSLESLVLKIIQDHFKASNKKGVKGELIKR